MAEVLLLFFSIKLLDILDHICVFGIYLVNIYGGWLIGLVPNHFNMLSVLRPKRLVVLNCEPLPGNVVIVHKERLDNAMNKDLYLLPHLNVLTFCADNLRDY